MCVAAACDCSVRKRLQYRLIGRQLIEYSVCCTRSAVDTNSGLVFCNQQLRDDYDVGDDNGNDENGAITDGHVPERLRDHVLVCLCCLCVFGYGKSSLASENNPKQQVTLRSLTSVRNGESRS